MIAASAHEAGALVNEAEIHRFLSLIHAAAARALDGASDPGMLQLVRISPNGGSPITTRFAIGNVGLMVEDAVLAARSGLNVYTEPRTVAARSSGRGKAGETRGVFGFVDDADHDKGKGGSLSIEPSIVVETSPGNKHSWLLLDRALTPEQAEPIGRAMRLATKSDSASGKLTQPFRVAGTPNWPDARKSARGRCVAPTRILSGNGPVWSVAQLRAAFPPIVSGNTRKRPSGRSGQTSTTVEALAAGAGPDRSGRFFATIIEAIKAGLLPDDLEDLFRRYPDGCASKYLEPYDRLRAEIDRAWPKAEANTGEQAAHPSIDPTYPDHAVPVEEARQAVRKALQAHFAAGTGHRALRVSTGVGKTRIAAEIIAEDIRRRRALLDKSAALFLVPTHRLGDEVRSLFEEAGVTAKVFRGRGADDPKTPGTGLKMCHDIEAVDLALQLGRTVSTSCCKGEHPATGTMHYCPHFNTCAYQQQIRETPDVWIGSHELLFSAPAGLGHVGSVTIDEGFWQAGIRIAKKRGLTLDELGSPPALGNRFEDLMIADLAAHRSALARAIGQQEELGGVQRRHLTEGEIDAALCNSANSAEWRLKSSVQMWPGMEKPARQAAAKSAVKAGRVGMYSSVWNAARDLVERENAEAVSGRLVLCEIDTEDGFGKARGVRTRGIRKVLQRWLDVPVMMLDATLPDVGILRRYFPDIEVVGDVEAQMPHAHIRQVVGAPTSAGKLLRSEAGWNRKAVRRAVLHRFVHAGRCSTLVICQLELEVWLQTEGLPAGVMTAHFGAVAGLDQFKDVALLIIVGRTALNVVDAEEYAGALTGLAPLRTVEPVKGPRWYNRVCLGLRIADGSGYPVQGDRHPDPIAETVRWQIAEAGVIQAIGRARGVNRTAANPVDIEIWTDLALPLTIDEVTTWDKMPAGYEADMLADGVWLESPSDMAVCWPKVWETDEAAKQWIKRGTRCQPPIRDTLHTGMTPCEFQYQRTGPRQKWRKGWADLAVVADPKVWLEARLGTLAGYRSVGGEAETGHSETAADEKEWSEARSSLEHGRSSKKIQCYS